MRIKKGLLVSPFFVSIDGYTEEGWKVGEGRSADAMTSSCITYKRDIEALPAVKQTIK
jgi:hypothetical protein